MSDTTVSVRRLAGAEGYRLSDDLARLCLPSEFRDSYRALAWVDSICFLFLLIGLIGLRPPKIIEKPVIGPPEAVPAIFTPPEEQPKQEPIVQQEQPQQEQQETTIETPPIPTVVAANTPNVAFAVPVEGPVVLAPVNRAPPPPAVTRAPPAQPKTFVPGQGEGGTFPWPTSYPREALEQRLQGTVMLYVVVDTNGVPTQVDIKESSRHTVLDRYAMQWVKSRWRWLPAETRYYYVPFQFNLQGG
jgi:protein TonB